MGRRVIVNWRSSRINICSGQKSYSELEEDIRDSSNRSKGSSRTIGIGLALRVKQIS